MYSGFVDDSDKQDHKDESNKKIWIIRDILQRKIIESDKSTIADRINGSIRIFSKTTDSNKHMKKIRRHDGQNVATTTVTFRTLVPLFQYMICVHEKDENKTEEKCFCHGTYLPFA